jgi:hypothetical protein
MSMGALKLAPLTSIRIVFALPHKGADKLNNANTQTADDEGRI